MSYPRLLSANPKAIKGAQWYQSFEQNRPEMDASAFPKEADVLEARFPQNANQNKPFNFLGLETGIQTEILRYSLNVPFNGRDILPTYNQFSVQMIEEESGSFEDYDTAVFRTNHHIHDLASYILYGLNTFCFYSPDEADWWFERIAGNIRNLRKVYFELGAGLSTRFRVREIRYERLWFIFFCSKHFNAAVGNLKEMKINTRRWGPEFADPTIFGPRVDIMLKLLEIRGLSWAGVGRGVFMQAAEASVIRRAMMLKEGETDDTIERLKNIAMTYKEDAAGGRMGFYRFGRKSMAAH
ncbi:hypothetical protein MMC21_002690 [Puttea exsequens]|nr:hypothetical protein [Puttea exsequens]